MHLIHDARHLLFLFLGALAVHGAKQGQVVRVLRTLGLILLGLRWVAGSMIVLQYQMWLHATRTH